MHMCITVGFLGLLLCLLICLQRWGRCNSEFGHPRTIACSTVSSLLSHENRPGCVLAGREEKQRQESMHFDIFPERNHVWVA